MRMPRYKMVVAGLIIVSIGVFPGFLFGNDHETVNDGVNNETTTVDRNETIQEEQTSSEGNETIVKGVSRKAQAQRPAGIKLINLSFEETPLRDVVADIVRQSGLPLQIDWSEFAACGIKPDDTITVKGKYLPVGVALQKVFDQNPDDQKAAIICRMNPKGFIAVQPSAFLEPVESEPVDTDTEVNALALEMPESQVAHAFIGGYGGGGGGRQGGYGGGQGGYGGGGGAGFGWEAQQLMWLIRTTIEPDSWDNNAGMGGRGGVGGRQGMNRGMQRQY